MSAPVVQVAWAERRQRELYESGYRDAQQGIRPRPPLRQELCCCYWLVSRGGEGAEGRGAMSPCETAAALVTAILLEHAAAGEVAS